MCVLQFTKDVYVYTAVLVTTRKKQWSHGPPYDGQARPRRNLKFDKRETVKKIKFTLTIGTVFSKEPRLTITDIARVCLDAFPVDTR